MTELNNIPMSVAELKDKIKQYVVAKDYDNGIAPLLFDSKPGLGKTQITEQVCKENGWGLVVIHYGKMGPEEKTGIPVPKTIIMHIPNKDYNPETDDEENAYIKKEFNCLEMSYPDFMTQMYDVYRRVLEDRKNNPNKYDKNDIYQKNPHLIIALDDSHNISPDDQGDFYEILTENASKGRKFPPISKIIIHGNFTSDLANPRETLSAIINRVQAYKLEADLKYWIEQYANPMMTKGKFHHLISHFLLYCHESNNVDYFHEEEKRTPWASPRSWTAFAKQLKAYEVLFNEKFEGSTEQSKSIQNLKRMAEAHIGEEAAKEFILFVIEYSKVDIEKAINDPDNYPIVDDLNMLYPFAIVLIGKLYKEKKRKKMVDVYTKFINRIMNECSITNKNVTVKFMFQYTLHLENEGPGNGAAFIEKIEKIMSDKYNKNIMEYFTNSKEDFSKFDDEDE